MNEGLPILEQRSEKNLERKHKRVLEETNDRKQTDQTLATLEEKMGSATDKKESPEVIRQQWLRGIEQELKLEKGSLKLGKPEFTIRRSVEQHGVYLNGKIIGTIAAGSENGRVVRDESKYDYSNSPDPNFLEKGFRAQVIEVVEQASE
jgi:hypothetical protein